jgi:hypothetical protein
MALFAKKPENKISSPVIFFYMTGMAGGLGDALAVGEEEAAMVREMKPYVEKYKNVTFESFEPVEMRTQVVAGTNYFIKVKTLVAGLPGPAPRCTHSCWRARGYARSRSLKHHLYDGHEYPRVIDFGTWDGTHVCT